MGAWQRSVLFRFLDYGAIRKLFYKKNCMKGHPLFGGMTKIQKNGRQPSPDRRPKRIFTSVISLKTKIARGIIMPFTFNITIKSPEQAIAKVKAAIEAKGGRFDGDFRKGEICGKTPVGDIKGSYAVVDNTAKITIREKPFLLPESTIKNEMEKFFLSV